MNKNSDLYNSLDVSTVRSINAFLEVYEKTLSDLNPTNKADYKIAKEMALKETSNKYPMLRAHYDTFLYYWGTRKEHGMVTSKSSREVIIGHKLWVGISVACRKLNFVRNNKVSEDKVDIKKEDENMSLEEHKTIASLYKEWIDNNDFVASDKMLCHFLGVTRGALTGPRSVWSKEGYKFEQVENGWKVTERPDSTINKMLGELGINNGHRKEAEELLLKLLALTK